MQQQDPTNLSEFVTAAKTKGASDEFLAALLLRRGWPTEEIYTALGDYWEAATGLTVPMRPGTGESSRDAFLYLLSFLTLGTWATALGSMIFHFLDHWFPDPVTTSTFYKQSVSWQMASIAVAFPIYMLVMRFILREAKDPERLRSGVRKWLTYIALLITAATMICDLIAFLNAFLQGELTARFVLKAATVMLICGGIFAWYLGFLRWSRVAARAIGSTRTTAFATLATAAVVVTFLGGFAITGAPSHQRQIQADSKRVDDLRGIATAIKVWHDRAATDAAMQPFPANLSDLSARGLLSGSIRDPETKAPYEYIRVSGTRYQLCASFADFTSEQPGPRTSDFWNHPKGRVCFGLNAAEAVTF